MEDQTRDLPVSGRPPRGLWLLSAAVVVAVLVAIRKLGLLFGLGVSVRLASQFGGAVVWVLFVGGAYQFYRDQGLGSQILPQHKSKVYAWWGIVGLAFVYGMKSGNSWNLAGKEGITLFLFSLPLLLGVSDKFWEFISKYLTVVTYVGFALIMMYYRTPAPIISYEGTQDASNAWVGIRYLGTLGMEFRVLVAPALFLGIWGAIQKRRNLWSGLQMLAFALGFWVEVGLFKFRGVAALYAFALAMYVVVRPVLEKRQRPGMTALVLGGGAICAGVLLSLPSGEVLMDRFGGTTGVSMFQARQLEVTALVSDLGHEIIVGRGLGGGYDASEIYGPSGRNWTTTHFGILVFALKGGAPLLATFVTIVVPGFWRRSSEWYQNEKNLTAAVLFPVYVGLFVVNPFTLNPVMILGYAAPMMVLGRFARREDSGS